MKLILYFVFINKGSDNMAKLSINSYLGDDKLIDLINNAGGGQHLLK